MVEVEAYSVIPVISLVTLPGIVPINLRVLNLPVGIELARC